MSSSSSSSSSAGASALVARFLGGYPPELLAQVLPVLQAGRLAESLARRHPAPHSVRTDGALYAYTMEFKQRHMRQSGPLSLVAYDPRLKVLTQALGTHTAISRVQGGRLKAKREIRVASLFRDAPADFLRMIVVHELAHLKEREHAKAFYALCTHLAPDYHQLEFDTRLWLLEREWARRTGPAPTGEA